MSLFKKKKEEPSASACCCGQTNVGVTQTERTTSTCCGEKTDGVCCVKVLGSGCASCHALYENAQRAVIQAGLNVEVEYVTDMEKIMGYGVMSMPALVINEKVVSVGKVLKATEIQLLFTKE